MPRRNHNAAPASPVPAHLCGACRINPATHGGYCALCKGVIARDARRSTLTRR